MAVEHGFDLAGALRPKGFEAHRAADKGPGDSWRVALPRGLGAQDVLRAALETGAPIVGFQPEEARLRDVFVSLVGEAEAAALDVPVAADVGEAA
jgi:ABC-2 type transport system ATP-binding protein